MLSTLQSSSSSDDENSQSRRGLPSNAVCVRGSAGAVPVVHTKLTGSASGPPSSTSPSDTTQPLKTSTSTSSQKLSYLPTPCSTSHENIVSIGSQVAVLGFTQGNFNEELVRVLY